MLGPITCCINTAATAAAVNAFAFAIALSAAPTSARLVHTGYTATAAPAISAFVITTSAAIAVVTDDNIVCSRRLCTIYVAAPAGKRFVTAPTGTSIDAIRCHVAAVALQPPLPPGIER